MEPSVGDIVQVHIEVPRHSFVKFKANGEVDFLSPVPAPLNYGCLPEVLGGDGDPLDALVFGPRAPSGAVVAGRVIGVVHFVDHSLIDDKLLVLPADVRLGRWDLTRIRAFFAVYIWVKWGIGKLRRKTGHTTVDGIVWAP